MRDSHVAGSRNQILPKGRRLIVAGVDAKCPLTSHAIGSRSEHAASSTVKQRWASKIGGRPAAPFSALDCVPFSSAVSPAIHGPRQSLFCALLGVSEFTLPIGWLP
jgi:hypothetical protein